MMMEVETQDLHLSRSIALSSLSVNVNHAFEKM